MRVLCVSNFKAEVNVLDNLTFEFEKKTSRLESLEWDNVWWEQTEDNTSKRVLYIGDSISCGIRHQISNLSDNKVLCDGFATSKSLDNPYFKDSLELFMKQQNKCDVILFNNGLHGWHLSDLEYQKYYEEILKFLLKRNIPIFVLLTTGVTTNHDDGQVVKCRNKIAEALAKKYNLPIIDLYSVSVEIASLHTDGIHFQTSGYEKLAKYILKFI